MRRRPVCLACLLLMGLLAVLNLRGICLLPEPSGNRKADLLDGTEVTVTGKVRISEEKEDYTDCVLTDAYLLGSSEAVRIGDVRLYLAEPEVFPAGLRLRAEGTLCKVPAATNPGQFDTELYYRIQNIRYRMKKARIRSRGRSFDPFRERLAEIRRRLRKRIAEVFPGKEAGIFAAMLIGDKSLIEEESRIRWQTAGVVHMLAISGLHLTVLGMGLYHILKKIRLPDRAAIPGSVAVMLLYCVFTGLAVSTLRAFLMFAVLLSARLFGRTYDPPTALALAAILILLENPYYLFYSGFQLSFAAVFFCILFGRRTKLMTSLMLTLGMLPLILNSFYEIPFYSIPVNLIAVPLLPVLLGAGITGTVCGGIAAVPGIFLLRFLDFLFRFTEKLPCASLIAGKPGHVNLVLFYVLYAVWAFYLNKYRSYKRKVLLLGLIPLLILVLTAHPEKKLRMTFLDVGQGDSCLIETPHRKNILIDGGSSTVQNVGTWRILPALKAEGVRQLDYLIVTHMDADHISGVEEILEKVSEQRTTLKIRTVIVPFLREKGESYRKLLRLAGHAGARVLAVSSGDRITMDRCEMDIWNPDPSLEGTPADENAQCVVLHFRYRSFDALLTGDVSGEGEQHVLKEWNSRKDQNGSCEILKVAHHGSEYSTPDVFLRAVHPSYSVISVGRENRYGHPSPALLKRLQKCGTCILRTDRNGAVTVDTDGRTYRVSVGCGLCYNANEKGAGGKARVR